MEKQEVKEINQVYTRFRGGEIAMESYAVQIVLHHLPDGLLRCSVSSVDHEICWNCEHTGKISLEKYCNQHELGRVELRWIYGGILKSLKEARAYLLDVNCLILKPEQIYMDPRDEKIWNSYVPFYVKNVWKSLQELSQYFLGHLDKQDAEAVRIAYGMYQYFSQGGRNIEDAWAILCENQEEMDETTELSQREESIDRIEGDINRIVPTEEKPFPVVLWLVMGFGGALAVFLIAYVAFNEWYLSNVKKIAFLAAAVVFGAIAVFIWIKWGEKMKNKNPFHAENR